MNEKPVILKPTNITRLKNRDLHPTVRVSRMVYGQLETLAHRQCVSISTMATILLRAQISEVKQKKLNLNNFIN